MTLRLNTIFLLLLVFLISACSDNPIACYESDADSVEVNKSILFTNCSTNSDQYEWDFGDSVLSTDIHPKHFYSDTGTYIVELIAFSNLQGNSDRIEKTITVFDSSEKFIGNYIITWENEDALLKIEHGLTVGSVVISINGILFCNATAEGNYLTIDSQNYWNDDYNIISHGLGHLNNSMLDINIIVIDSFSNESIIHIVAEQVPV